VHVRSGGDHLSQSLVTDYEVGNVVLRPLHVEADHFTIGAADPDLVDLKQNVAGMLENGFGGVALFEDAVFEVKYE
jgi:hypothetical protein